MYSIGLDLEIFPLGRKADENLVKYLARSAKRAAFRIENVVRIGPQDFRISDAITAAASPRLNAW